MESVLLNDPVTGSIARVASHLGFNCFEFQADVDGRTIDVLDSADDFADGNQRPSGHGIPILFPFPNRIRDGRYTWDGRDYELSEDDVGFDAAGNAIHGFCLDRPWRVTARGDHFVVGEFQLSVDAPDRIPSWPTDFKIEIRYELHNACLRADVTITNPSQTPLPWGFGTHPYFRLPLEHGSEPQRCLIEAPAAECWELVDGLPTGRRTPVTGRQDLRQGAYFDTLTLDHVLTGLQPGPEALECVILDEAAGLQISQRCDPLFRELVVYTPPARNAVCLEPYTCITDAINLQQRGLDAGWRVLDPGDLVRSWIEIRAGLVIV